MVLPIPLQAIPEAPAAVPPAVPIATARGLSRSIIGSYSPTKPTVHHRTVWQIIFKAIGSMGGYQPRLYYGIRQSSCPTDSP